MIGQTLGHYRIVEKIGAGGMGEVYRAHDEQLDRDVALKVLPASCFRDETGRARLLREARAAAALNHPHICTIHEVGEAEGQAYIAMEYVEGQPLSTRLGSGPLPAEQLARYAVQLADALGHAHERRVVHRDLKSANVMITPDGRAKVLDFGLAKRVSDDEMNELTRSQASLTAPGQLLGTLAYMAPEQLCGQPADARSDIWALGVVLYEMAAGARPFQGQTGFELSSAILNQRPAALPGKVPVELRAVVDRCLEKEPGRRYQRSGEVRAALEAMQAGATVPWEAWRYRLARRGWLAVTASTMVLLAVLGALNLGRLRTHLWGRAPRIHSLAVLPLENLSGDAGQDYFADGMHEALITDLAKLSGFRKVTARSSVMAYKRTNKPLPQIGRELGVDAVMTGSVVRVGNRVQVTARLINAATEESLWADRYERELRDVLSLQNEVVGSITRAIKVQLTPQEQTRLASSHKVDPEAYNNYLLGRHFYNQRTPEGYRKATEYFQKAIDKDPNYAAAWALWADTAYDSSLTPAENAKRSHEALQKALQLDDSLAEVHTEIALEKIEQWDWGGAETELRRAIELNPNYAEGHHTYSHFLMGQGRVDDSLRESQRALESDPVNLAMIFHLAWHYFYAHQYEQAIAQCRRTLDFDPNYQPAHFTLAAAEAQKGEYAEAIAEFQKIPPAFAGGKEGSLGAWLGRTYALAGNKAEALKIVDRLLQLRGKNPSAPYNLAIVYLGLGDKERSLAFLKEAVDERAVSVHLDPVNKSPIFDSLHSDPRFQDLLRRIGLPP
jgi:eukaryotic-like serine/threonine-protein kinase